jgi:hypothetical protein
MGPLSTIGHGVCGVLLRGMDLFLETARDRLGAPERVRVAEGANEIPASGRDGSRLALATGRDHGLLGPNSADRADISDEGRVLAARDRARTPPCQRG